MDDGLDAVSRKCICKRLQHLIAVLLCLHVDHVDDDDATHVSQTNLPCNFLTCLQIQVEYGVLKLTVARIFRRVDINDGHCLAGVNNKCSAAVQPDMPFLRTLELLTDFVYHQQIFGN